VVAAVAAAAVVPGATQPPLVAPGPSLSPLVGTVGTQVQEVTGDGRSMELPMACLERAGELGQPDRVGLRVFRPGHPTPRTPHRQVRAELRVRRVPMAASTTSQVKSPSGMATLARVGLAS